MQCGLGLGFFVASATWHFVSGLGEDSWRYMFLLGVLPALFTLWLRRNVPESGQWSKVAARRAKLQEKSAEALSADERSFTSFTLRQIMADKRLRRLTILGSIMSGVTTLAWWGISTWVPAYVGSIAERDGHDAASYAATAGMIYNAGAIAGYIALGFAADRFGRKPTVFTYFAVSLLMTPVLFLWTNDLTLVLLMCVINGFFTLGQYSWMPVWLPEFYPTHLRATGAAFVFNAARASSRSSGRWWPARSSRPWAATALRPPWSGWCTSSACSWCRSARRRKGRPYRNNRLSGRRLTTNSVV